MTEQLEHELAKLRLQVDNLQIDNFKLKLKLKSPTLQLSASAEAAPRVAGSLPERLHSETVKTLTRQLEDERRLRHRAEEERDRVLATLHKLETLELQMVKDEMDALRKFTYN